jgi:hypothetical protein
VNIFWTRTPFRFLDCLGTAIPHQQQRNSQREPAPTLLKTTASYSRPIYCTPSCISRRPPTKPRTTARLQRPRHRYPASQTTQLAAASNNDTHQSATSLQQHDLNLWMPLVDSKRSVSPSPPPNFTPLTPPRSVLISSCTFLPHSTPPAGYQVPQP